MGFFKFLFKKKPTSSQALDKKPAFGHSLKESGNVFMMLFGAVGMVGVIGASTMTVMKGPVKTMSQVTKRTIAENNMIAAGKLALIAAGQQASNGDCDGDNTVEPIPFAGPLTGFTGGGTLPATIGVAKEDPWGNEYGYCTWDHGTEADGDCGGSTNFRTGDTATSEYVLAIVSAGPDRMFNTSCNDFVAPGTPILNKTGGADDIVLGYTYAEAATIAAIWNDDSPTSTSISRDVVVKDAGDTEQFKIDTAAQTLTFGNAGAGTGQFPSIQTDFLSSYNNTPIDISSPLSSDSNIVTTGDLDGANFDASGTLDVSGATTLAGLTAGATTLGSTGVSSLNAGSGAITTTGTLNAGTSTLGSTGVSSLNAGSGAITTTGTLNAGTSTLGATGVSSLNAGSGAITTTGTLNAGTSTLGATGVNSLNAGSGAIATTGTLNAGVTNLGATTLAGALAMGGNKITGLGTPTGVADAATKAYVDTQVAAGTGFSEQDPQVGDVGTSGKWCQTDGDSVECTFDLPGETDPQVGTLTNTKWCSTDGTTIDCTQDPPAGSDTLNDLSCTNGEIAKFNGATWVCAKDGVGGGGIVVETENYNLTFTQLDPASAITATEQMINPSVMGGDFGDTIDIDGDYAVIGAKGQNGNAGAVYVFYKNGGGSWVEQQKIQVAAGSYFGSSVAIDGSTLVIGAYLENNGGSTGSAYVFTRSGTTWSQQAKLVPADGGSDWFGSTVDVNNNTVIVAAPTDDDNGSNGGAVYAFTRSGTTWTQEQKITADTSTSGHGFSSKSYGYGKSIAIDNDTILVGAPAASTGRGDVYIFTRSGTTWTQAQKVRGSSVGAEHHFGNSVAIDGDTFVAGAPGDGTTITYAYVFTRSGATWSQQQRFKGSDTTTGDIFGGDVDIDGDTIIIGADADDDVGNATGTAFLFTRTGSTWTQLNKFIPSNGSTFVTRFGKGVSIGNGSLVIVNDSDDAFFYDTATSTLNGQISDAGTNGTLAGYIPKGSVFEVQGTASNDGIYSTHSVANSDTVNITDVVTTETNVPAVILKTTIPNPLEALSCSDGQITVYNGTLGTWECGNASSSDTLSSLSCSSSEVAQWDGSDWVCASVASADTLNGLSCSSGEIAKWNGSAWACAADSNDGADLCDGSGGSSWTAQTAAAASQWKGITYGNNQFVAVANLGTNRVMTSPDGITWTARTAAAANDWYAIAFGNGVYVATGTSGANRVMTSPDGITWTARTAAEANLWRAVTFGNGLFVAVAQTGTNRVMTSPDGITWTARTAAEANAWSEVTYANGQFVAVSSDGTNRVMTSPDGITWTARTAAEANNWRGITYGNGKFVAVAQTGTNRVMTSPDGITWTAQAAAEANTWLSVTYANGQFIAVSNDGTNRVMTSPDGITWTAQAAAEANAWETVTYANGQFVAVSSNGTNRVMTSDASTCDAPNDTFSQLSCTDGQVAAWNASSTIWECATASGTDNLGDHTATQDLDMATFEIDNTNAVIYNGVAGNAPLGGGGDIQAGIITTAVSGNACGEVGKLARTAGGDLLVCEDATTITDDSCSSFTVGALSISSDGALHVCMN